MLNSKILSNAFDEDRNLKINIINGIAAAIVLNLVNPYFSKFIQRMGGNHYHIGFLSSLPALISVFALIPGAILIESAKNKQKTTAYIMEFHKLFYLLLAFVPMLPQNFRPTVFVILVGLMNFPGSISVMAFQSSIADIFEEHNRANAMSLRNKYSDIVKLIVTFAAGQSLKLIPQNNAETITLYQVFFIIAFFISQIEVFSFCKFKYNNTTDSHKIKYFDRLIATLKEIPHQKQFLLFSLCSLIFHFGWQMGWPLFNIYMIDNLGADEGWLAAISIAAGISSILTVRMWARFSQNHGNTMALSIATFGMAITPILYTFANTIHILVLFNIIIGISVAGTVLILFNILLEAVPTENRTIYLAVYTTVINISATISPIIGVFLKNQIGIKNALIIVGLLRLLGSVSFFIKNKYFPR